MKSRIHINQHVIRRNAKTGERQPVITVKQGRTNRYATEVEIQGPSRVVYSPDKPLSCGAKVWVETHAPVVLHGETNGPVAQLEECRFPKPEDAGSKPAGTTNEAKARRKRILRG